MDQKEPIYYFTVDLEDWFQTEAAQEVYPPIIWYKQKSRVERNIKTILELLAKHNAKATFFTLGWINDRFPRLIKEIHSAGHEIASHGFDHIQLFKKTPDEFLSDLVQSKKSLEDTIGDKIVGYRAPMFSVRKETEWAFEILKEEGFLYDSSIYPTSMRPDRPPYSPKTEPYQHPNGLWEFPLPVFKFGKLQIAFGGGFYLRVMPLSWTLGLLRKYPGSIIYIHPWEIDLEPSPNMTLKGGIRQNTGLKTNLHKVETILKTFKFDTLKSRLS
jgi:polysaccharide deacetylase family protein (PEP-CTERM system associated)